MRYFLLTLSLLTAASSYAGIPRTLTAEELDSHRRMAEPSPVPHFVRPLSDQETANREEKLAPVAAELAKADAKDRAAMQKSADFNLEGDKTVRVFLEKVGEKDIDIPSTPVNAPAALAETAAAAGKAGNKADAQAILSTVTCEDGLYFDSEKGLLVYLKDVVLVDPRFSLKCDDQLKVYLRHEPKKDKTPKAEPAKEEPIKLPALSGDGFSGVDYISAMGNVVMTRTDPKTKEIVEVRGQKATYNGKTAEIIVSGGNEQTVRQGVNFTRVSGKDSYIRVDPDGNVRFHGRIDGKANIESLQKDKKDKPGKNSGKGGESRSKK